MTNRELFSAKLRRLRTLVLGCVIALSTAASIADESTGSLDSRIVFVNKLITESSASRRVAASENAGAKQLQEEAETHYRQAIDARAAGDSLAANAHLAEAIKSMYAAVGVAENPQQQDVLDNRAYEEHLASIDALLSAHERISNEKDLKGTHQTLKLAIAEDVAVAKRHYDDGDAVEAKAHIAAAYKTVIQAVEDLRQGETLVRELNFETDEAEYLYELDRNETHEMLFNLLVENVAMHNINYQVSKDLFAAAVALRREAEGFASAGDYEAATRLLEQSTSEFIKAIRGAGVYIPG
jgi:hypothetical protein